MKRWALAWLAAALMAAMPDVSNAAANAATNAAPNAAASAAAGAGHAAAPASAAVARLPAFSALDGTAITSAQLAGKTTVVAFFSSTCPFCMNEAPKLQKLYRENRQVLNVVSVNIEVGDPAQASKAAAWARKYGLTHPVTLDYRAIEAVLGKPKGIPALYVFDRHGTLIRSEIGEMLDEDFDDIAREARKP
jgi:thiol-disulfide isomerase/thioredoxin